MGAILTCLFKRFWGSEDDDHSNKGQSESYKNENNSPFEHQEISVYLVQPINQGEQMKVFSEWLRRALKSLQFYRKINVADDCDYNTFRTKSILKTDSFVIYYKDWSNSRAFEDDEKTFLKELQSKGTSIAPYTF